MTDTDDAPYLDYAEITPSGNLRLTWSHVERFVMKVRVNGGRYYPRRGTQEWEAERAPWRETIPAEREVAEAFLAWFEEEGRGEKWPEETADHALATYDLWRGGEPIPGPSNARPGGPVAR